jgi:hypothetical protein
MPCLLGWPPVMPREMRQVTQPVQRFAAVVKEPGRPLGLTQAE